MRAGSVSFRSLFVLLNGQLRSISFRSLFVLLNSQLCSVSCFSCLLPFTVDAYFYESPVNA